MKIVFLDVDGVIKPHGLAGCACIEPHALNYRGWPIEYVQRIVDICNRVEECGVVITSSWRKISRSHRMPGWWQNQFEQLGFKINVLGVTDSAVNSFRGREVNHWIRLHEIFDIDRYVILDDDSDFYENQPFYHVRGELGLQDEDVDTIVAWLNNGTSFLNHNLKVYHRETDKYDNNTWSLYHGYKNKLHY